MRFVFTGLVVMATGCGGALHTSDLYAVQQGQVRCIGQDYRSTYGSETYCRWNCIPMDDGNHEVNLIFVGTRLDQEVLVACR